jgi:ribosome-associated protein
MKKTDSSHELAVAAADLAADGKALDICVLQLREISSVADYFVLASGRSHIQVEAICDRIVEGVQERLRYKPISVEGLENSQWAVLDYGSVVIHVFQEGVRKLYDLERLWSLAPSWKHGEEPASPKAARGSSKSGKAARGSSKSGKVAKASAPAAEAEAEQPQPDAPPARKKSTGSRSRAAAG